MKVSNYGEARLGRIALGLRLTAEVKAAARRRRPIGYG